MKKKKKYVVLGFDNAGFGRGEGQFISFKHFVDTEEQAKAIADVVKYSVWNRYDGGNVLVVDVESFEEDTGWTIRSAIRSKSMARDSYEFEDNSIYTIKGDSSLGHAAEVEKLIEDPDAWLKDNNL